MNPNMIQIGDFTIKWYSVFILIGVVLAFLLAILEGKKKGIEKNFIFDLGFWVVIFGLIGARIYYVIFNFSFYKHDLFEIFKVWNGGLAIHGGIIAGLLTLIVYCKKHHVKILTITDIVAPSLLLAQAIGRWGNFFNSEAHGPLTTLENLQNLHIPNFIIQGMHIEGVYYHPTFLYESLWCLLGFFLLLFIRSLFKNLKEGELTFLYFLWYGVGRFFIESLRTDSLMLGTFKMAQLVSILMVFVGFIGLLILLILNIMKYKEVKDK